MKVFTFILCIGLYLVIIHHLFDEGKNEIETNNRFTTLQNEMKCVESELRELRGELESLKAKTTKTSFRVTSYFPTKKLTATNKKGVVGKTAAVGTDARHLLGKKIWIKGLGVFHATDIMPELEDIDLMLTKKITPSMREVRVVH